LNQIIKIREISKSSDAKILEKKRLKKKRNLINGRIYFSKTNKEFLKIREEISIKKLDQNKEKKIKHKMNL